MRKFIIEIIRENKDSMVIESFTGECENFDRAVDKANEYIRLEELRRCKTVKLRIKSIQENLRKLYTVRCGLHDNYWHMPFSRSYRVEAYSEKCAIDKAKDLLLLDYPDNRINFIEIEEVEEVKNV